MGSDGFFFKIQSFYALFQSTLPYGERLTKPQVLSDLADVSIHAPVWGATNSGSAGSGTGNGFNPRSRMGSDPVEIRGVLVYDGFNPRSRMGSDGLPSALSEYLTCFNPRSRMGSDQLHGRLFIIVRSFNPRSRMGSDSNHVQFFYHFP